jgi:hypothetical protein
MLNENCFAAPPSASDATLRLTKKNTAFSRVIHNSPRKTPNFPGKSKIFITDACKTRYFYDTLGRHERNRYPSYGEQPIWQQQ